MTTQSFTDLLRQHPEKELIFNFGNGHELPKSWHITEIKSIHVDSVDCGGNLHAYQETVVQLWISEKESPEKHMLASKALKIFDIVNGKQPLRMATDIRFEYGYRDLPTSVYNIDQVKEEAGQLVFDLSVPATACKPLLVAESSCCGPGCC